MSGVESAHELASRCRQLAERCYRLAANAYDPTVGKALKRWGDVLNAKADDLEKAKDEPKGEAD